MTQVTLQSDVNARKQTRFEKKIKISNLYSNSFGKEIYIHGTFPLYLWLTFLHQFQENYYEYKSYKEEILSNFISTQAGWKIKQVKIKFVKASKSGFGQIQDIRQNVQFLCSFLEFPLFLIVCLAVYISYNTCFVFSKRRQHEHFFKSSSNT